jgi:hypothetical protein
MKKIIFNIRLLLLGSVISSIGLWTSCKSDNSVSLSSKVQLISFGPTGSQIGDTISFIGNNLNNVTKIKFTGDSVLQAAFIKQSYGLIKAIVPPYTTKGFVTLYAPKDTTVSKTMFDLLVPVTIVSIPAVVRPGGTMTITGQYVNWISEVWFSKNVVVRDSNFISKTLTQIVLKVPMTAQTGPIVINTKGVKPLSINPVNIVTVTMPTITSFGLIPLNRGDNLTIIGTDLDLTKGIIFKGSGTTGLTDTIKSFVSKTPTQIVVTVPQTAAKGPLTLVTYSDLPVVSTVKVQFIGDIPDLAPLAYAFYEDALMNGWQNWGWGSTVDLANTEQVRDGNNSIKATFTGSWGALKFANGSVATSTYTQFVFSVYGGPGTDGKTFNVQPTGGSTFSAPIKEGTWVEIVIPLSTLGNVNPITELLMQETGWSGYVYLDHIGFR